MSWRNDGVVGYVEIFKRRTYRLLLALSSAQRIIELGDRSMIDGRAVWTFLECRAALGMRKTSEWEDVSQSRIDHFAQCTGDYAFIHVDPARAAKTRFGGTIAHGLLTLSLLPLFMRTAVPKLADARMSVNYGFDQIRFIAPVPAGSRLRGHFTLAAAAEERPGFAKIEYDVSVEIEGSDRQALAATWIIGHWIGDKSKATPTNVDEAE